MSRAVEIGRRRRRAAVLAAHSRGLGLRAIARELGLTPGVVGGILFRAGLCDPRNHPAFMARAIDVLARHKPPSKAPILSKAAVAWAEVAP